MVLARDHSPAMADRDGRVRTAGTGTAAAIAEDPRGQPFLKRSGARKPPQAAGKKAAGEGFGRA
ncbi:hypothetical protein X732_15550 [Mesorhizobium sp. L2C066B000]|nr:hypothetical protein X732_15550 [Mesorhizobium sp. L2C066B000]